MESAKKKSRKKWVSKSFSKIFKMGVQDLSRWVSKISTKISKISLQAPAKIRFKH